MPELTIVQRVLNCVSSVYQTTSFFCIYADATFGSHMDEARILCKCILKYASRNRAEAEVLFQLLRAFSVRGLADFHFLKTWFEEEIPEKYTVNEKRMVCGCGAVDSGKDADNRRVCRQRS